MRSNFTLLLGLSLSRSAWAGGSSDASHGDVASRALNYVVGIDASSVLPLSTALRQAICPGEQAENVDRLLAEEVAAALSYGHMGDLPTFADSTRSSLPASLAAASPCALLGSPLSASSLREPLGHPDLAILSAMLGTATTTTAAATTTTAALPEAKARALRIIVAVRDPRRFQSCGASSLEEAAAEGAHGSSSSSLRGLRIAHTHMAVGLANLEQFASAAATSQEEEELGAAEVAATGAGLGSFSRSGQLSSVLAGPVHMVFVDPDRLDDESFARLVSLCLGDAADTSTSDGVLETGQPAPPTTPAASTAAAAMRTFASSASSSACGGGGSGNDGQQGENDTYAVGSAEREVRLLHHRFVARALELSAASEGNHQRRTRPASAGRGGRGAADLRLFTATNINVLAAVPPPPPAAAGIVYGADWTLRKRHFSSGGTVEKNSPPPSSSSSSSSLSRGMKTRETSKPASHSPFPIHLPRVVFFAGLEGTGHHALEALLRPCTLTPPRPSRPPAAAAATTTAATTAHGGVGVAATSGAPACASECLRGDARPLTGADPAHNAPLQTLVWRIFDLDPPKLASSLKRQLLPHAIRSASAAAAGTSTAAAIFHQPDNNNNPTTTDAQRVAWRDSVKNLALALKRMRRTMVRHSNATVAKSGGLSSSSSPPAVRTVALNLLCVASPGYQMSYPNGMPKQQQVPEDPSDDQSGYYNKVGGDAHVTRRRRGGTSRGMSDRPLLYPNLRLLAELVESAGFDFRVLVLTRRPEPILVSTAVKRNFGDKQYGLGGFLGQAATIAANHAVLLAQLSQLDPRFAMCVAYEDMPPLELPKRGSDDLEEGGGEIESTRMPARLRRFIGVLSTPSPPPPPSHLWPSASGNRRRRLRTPRPRTPQAENRTKRTAAAADGRLLVANGKGIGGGGGGKMKGRTKTKRWRRQEGEDFDRSEAALILRSLESLHATFQRRVCRVHDGTRGIGSSSSSGSSSSGIGIGSSDIGSGGDGDNRRLATSTTQEWQRMAVRRGEPRDQEHTEPPVAAAAEEEEEEEEERPCAAAPLHYESWRKRPMRGGCGEVVARTTRTKTKGTTTRSVGRQQQHRLDALNRHTKFKNESLVLSRASVGSQVPMPTRPRRETLVREEESSKRWSATEEAAAAAAATSATEVEIIVAHYSKSLAWLNGHIEHLLNDIHKASSSSATAAAVPVGRNAERAPLVEVFCYLKGDHREEEGGTTAAPSGSSMILPRSGSEFRAAMEKLGLRVPAAASYGQERGGGQERGAKASSSHSSEVRYSLARLPNVGREFHTFAYHFLHSLCPRFGCGEDAEVWGGTRGGARHMASPKPKPPPPRVLVFLKDSAPKEGGFDAQHRWVPSLHFQHMVATARRTGLADITGRPGGLALRSTHLNSHWLDWKIPTNQAKARQHPHQQRLSEEAGGNGRAVDYQPRWRQSNGTLHLAEPRGIRAWVAAHWRAFPLARRNVEAARRLCYKGVSAATPEAFLRYPPEFWRATASLLAVDDNVEAGHYMERLWCPLGTVRGATGAAAAAGGGERAVGRGGEQKEGGKKGTLGDSKSPIALHLFSGGSDGSGLEENEAAEEEGMHGRWWVHGAD